MTDKIKSSKRQGNVDSASKARWDEAISRMSLQIPFAARFLLAVSEWMLLD